MNFTHALEDFRLIASEFDDIEDAVVKKWFALAKPLVSRRRFRRVYSHALALRAAHMMKLAGVGVEEDPLADIGNINVSNFLKVSSYKEGQTAISFDHNVDQYADVDSDLLLTEYGIQFLSLKRKFVMPITSSAMPIHGGFL